MLSPRIETDRLILRRYKESDIDAIYEIITDERLAKYIKYPDLTKDEELECIKKWISEADENKYEKWVMELKSTGEVVGNIDVNTVVKKHNYCNVGYTVRYEFWGNGYAAEALKAVADHLLNNRGYYLVECSCNELNVQSFRVMEKAGFIKDGYISNRRLNKDGEILKLSKYICSFNSEIDVNAYAEQLNMLYGAVYEMNAFVPTMFDEIVEIETTRIKANGVSVTKLMNNVEMLIVEYSKIAFDLGRKSLYENRAFHIASALKIIFSELTSSTLIEKEMKLSLKNIISETELDFGYAAGNHNVASLRMAQLIREYKANNGGK